MKKISLLVSVFHVYLSSLFLRKSQPAAVRPFLGGELCLNVVFPQETQVKHEYEKYERFFMHRMKKISSLTNFMLFKNCLRQEKGVWQ